MQCGLFGKLPAKRDFLALDVPRGFLTLWESFLEQSLAGSRALLTVPVWQQAYQSAAIWRFWLGPKLCGGMPFIGALMPSADALGRQFPLSLIAFDSVAPVMPPSIAPYEAWFGAVEQFLLSALGVGLELSLDAGLKELAAAPRCEAREDCSTPRRYRLASATEAERSGLSSLFASDTGICLDKASFWWTIGGAGLDPLAFRLQGLPGCEVFASMLTGRFSDMSKAELGSEAGAL